MHFVHRLNCGIITCSYVVMLLCYILTQMNYCICLSNNSTKPFASIFWALIINQITFKQETHSIVFVHKKHNYEWMSNNVLHNLIQTIILSISSLHVILDYYYYCFSISTCFRLILII